MDNLDNMFETNAKLLKMECLENVMQLLFSVLIIRDELLKLEGEILNSAWLVRVMRQKENLF